MYKDFVESLKGFIEELESTSFNSRKLSRLTIDVKTGNVDLSFEDEELNFQSFEDEEPTVKGFSLESFEIEADVLKCEWQAEFKRWQARHYGGITELDYREKANVELCALLKSDILTPDEDLINKEKLMQASAELEEMNLPVSYASKYALLSDLLKKKDGLFSFADMQRLNMYLNDNEDCISRNGINALIRFKFAMEFLSQHLCKEDQKEIILSSQDEALLKRILDYVPRGDWQMPATVDNVSLFLTTLFGGNMVILDKEDREMTRSFREFFKGGRAGEDTDRVEVSVANIIGYLKSYQLLAGGQKQISTDFFGYDIQVNNINKGKNGESSQAFIDLFPLMDKYRVKVIGEALKKF